MVTVFTESYHSRYRQHEMLISTIIIYCIVNIVVYSYIYIIYYHGELRHTPRHLLVRHRSHL